MWIPKLNTNACLCHMVYFNPPSSHQLLFTCHMQTVNTTAPLHSLAFCLYFLRQNNGYKRQSGKNKIWCKAQISVPEEWVNWLGGLVKNQPRREGEHYYWPTSALCMCQCFNNFLQASWPLAPVLLQRTKSHPPKLVFFHRSVCLCRHLCRTTAEEIHTIWSEFHHTVAFTTSRTVIQTSKTDKTHFTMQTHVAESFCDSISFNLFFSQSHSVNNVCVSV